MKKIKITQMSNLFYSSYDPRKLIIHVFSISVFIDFM